MVDIMIIARLNPESPLKVFDYYVIPKIAKLRGTFYLRARNNFGFLDLYRTDDLKMFIRSFGHVPIAEGAL